LQGKSKKEITHITNADGIVTNQVEEMTNIFADGFLKKIMDLTKNQEPIN